MSATDSSTPVCCAFCGETLKLLPSSLSARCLVCGERSQTRTWCTKGHFVCEACRGAELWALVEPLLRQDYSTDPVEILMRMRASHDFPMHGPEHHPLVAAAFLVAYYNQHGEPGWPVILDTVRSAAEQLPGGTCGFWGACSAALALGMAYSAILDSSPTSGVPRAAAHQVVARMVQRVGEFPGPRCCRRECLLTLQVACELSGELLPHPLATTLAIKCEQAAENPDCLGERCPYA